MPLGARCHGTREFSRAPPQSRPQCRARRPRSTWRRCRASSTARSAPRPPGSFSSASTACRFSPRTATGGAPPPVPTTSAAAPLALTGVPSQFIPCTTNTQCTSFGTTCDTARQFCVPGGTLAGCTAAQGCSPDGTYTFDNGTPTNAADDWQDVIRQIYGGMNHTTAATLIHDATEVNADGTAICFASAGGATRNCKRNPARIDCANPVRGVLLASYGQVIRSPLCTSSSPACVKIKHAFRRDDLSGTTDAFQAIVGLVALAAPTTLRSSAGGAFAPEIADFAVDGEPVLQRRHGGDEQGLLGRPRSRPVPPRLHHGSGARSPRPRVGLPGVRRADQQRRGLLRGRRDAGELPAARALLAAGPRRARRRLGRHDRRAPGGDAWRDDAAALPRRRPAGLDPAGPAGRRPSGRRTATRRAGPARPARSPRRTRCRRARSCARTASSSRAADLLLHAAVNTANGRFDCIADRPRRTSAAGRRLAGGHATPRVEPDAGQQRRPDGGAARQLPEPELPGRQPAPPLRAPLLRRPHGRVRTTRRRPPTIATGCTHETDTARSAAS